MNDKDGSIPPKTYNLSPQAHRPGLTFGKTIDGLNGKVNGLHSQGRFRSALDEIFKVLDKDPYNPQALDLALIIFGDIRTTHLQAQEPLTMAYLLDRRLDPIATVCSRCGKSWIGGDPLLMPGMQIFASLISFNSGAPRPMQCYHCGYVLCSVCITDIMADDPLESGTLPTKCPECGANELKRPAYPTGRPPQQMARHAEPVAEVIIFREGPVPPDEIFMRGLLAQYSPDAIENNAKLAGVPLFPWPANIEAVARNMLAEKIASGQILTEASAEFMRTSDEMGNRIYIAKLLKQINKNTKPASSASKIKYLINDAMIFFIGWLYYLRTRIVSSQQDRLSEGIMRHHLSRLKDFLADNPRSAIIPICETLSLPHVFSYVQSIIAAISPESIAESQHCWKSQRANDIYLIVSAIPVTIPSRVKNYFDGGYLRFFDDRIKDFAIQIGKVNIVHWIYCYDGIRTGVHLTIYPKKGEPIIAYDLLTDSEKSQLNIMKVD